MGKTQGLYMDIMALHKEVTGSCILVIIKFPNGTTKKIIVDCGLFQESEYSEFNKILPFNADEIDYVLVTHNHVDHTGRLPLLINKGYRGDIHMSYTTSKLISYALEDSYKVLKNRAKMLNESPLYNDSDVEETLKHVKGHPYEETFDLDDNIKVTLFMNGHLPGAVSILMQVKYHEYGSYHQDINVLFTGDYNNKNLFFDVPPIPKWVHQLPITIVQESTYGDMDSTDIDFVFENNVLSALSKGKEVVIPVFSLGRSQELMYILKTWQEEGKLDKNIPIYLDGKLARRYTSLYLKDGLDNKEECKDFSPENFYPVTDCEMRNQIMYDGECKIILTTSGMGSYGPAQVYLPTYLRKSNALIHFTGYCAENTLGRRLFECALEDNVDIAGLKVKKKADVQFTSEFSAHAKADELIDFLRPFENINLLLVNHGNTEKKETYANRVIDEVDPKNVGILGRDYFFRINGYGLEKTFTTKF